jgi:hypothetical protein
MFKTSLVLLFVYLSLGSLTAQTFIGKLNPVPNEPPSVSLQNDTIKILAVMADFPEDQDAATFGNGKFGSIYSQNYGSTILDPLPHDRNYFETHLEFVRNYYSKVSRGKAAIEYFVLPDVITVSQTMRNYSPPPGSDDFTPLANYSKEVWTIAGSIFSNFDFSEYDIFTIFHAGVGRDVSLPGSIGNERDLPSVYLSDKALREILSDPSGLPLNREGKYNSMIIPETESREVQTFGGIFLFQLSINGLLAASVASHLGLPDLFNTETGLSAIGRFGLMDGQAIFAYSGTFPPEPSAWEKIYLGWEEPVILTPGDYDIGLVTKIASVPGDTVILKVPVNSSEYFLVENRIRDANNDGAIVTYIVDGETRTKVFTKDTTGFLNFPVDSLAGVIIDVDEFDWAIPNAKTVDDNVYNPIPGGGIVIWHIDENIINARITDNKINVDKNNRGVDVEEADGVQDIGERFFTVFGDEIIGEGFIEDYWHASNPARLYRNRFSKDTRPNTNSNSGANSLITFSDFSEIGSRMTFKVSYGDSVIKPVFSTVLPFASQGNKLNLLQGENNFSFNLLAGNTLYRLNNSGELIDSLNNFSQYKTASAFFAGAEFVAGAYESLLNVLINYDTIIGEISIDTEEIITAPPVIKMSDSQQYQILAGTERGNIHIYNLESRPPYLTLSSTFETDTSLVIKKIAADGSYFSFITESKFIPVTSSVLPLFQDNQGRSFSFTAEQPVDLALTKDRNGNYISVILTDQNSFYTISDGNVLNYFKINSAADITSFSLADLKRDGENYIILNNGEFIEAYNLKGAKAENFPFADPLSLGFNGTPVSADFEGTDNSEIISLTNDGRIFAVDGGTGRVVNGFPLTIGSQSSSVPVIFNDRGRISLAAIDNNNNFSAWNIGLTEGNVFWSEENGSSGSSAFVDLASNQNFTNEFFPKNRVYNYPNPVYDNTTNIRYYVAEDSRINIKVFDLAGGFVAELNDDAAGGFDNETVWNVSNIQSGVYLARIEATASSGKTESNVIKIAIVK